MATDHKLDHKITANSEDPVFQMHSYDVDLQSNHIFLMGTESYATGLESAIGEPGVDYTMANRFIRNMNLCMRVNPNKPILIHMKSCGGDHSEGMAIYDTIKACPFPVTVLNYTHARSMSSLILQAANKRVMMPHSYFLFHEGTIAVDGTFKTVTSNVEFEKLRREEMVDIYVEVLKRDGKYKTRSKKFIRAWVNEQMNQKEDVFLSSKFAVEMGFADQVFDYNWSKLLEYTDEELARG